MAVHLASQSFPIERREPDASWGITCPMVAWEGRVGTGRWTWPWEVMRWPDGTTAVIVGCAELGDLKERLPRSLARMK